MSQIKVTVSPVPFGGRVEGLAGRPQTNARVYLSLVGCERLAHEGMTPKRIRRAAFASLRSTLGLSRDTVIVEHPSQGYFMVKSRDLQTNLVVTVTPSAE